MKNESTDNGEFIVCSFCEGVYAEETLIRGPRGNICGRCIEICLGQLYSFGSNKRREFPSVHFDLNKFDDPGQVEIILQRMLFIGNSDPHLLDDIDGYTERVYDKAMSEMNWLGMIRKEPRDDDTPDPDPELPDIVA